MKFIYTILILAGFIFDPAISFSQEISEFPPDTTGVFVHADPRLDIIVSALKPKSASKGMIRSGRGYRVQIYNGNDRNKATEIKVDFMRRFPEIRTYMTYIQPQFRVKAGDFRTRAEAQKLYQQLLNLYSSVMIVPDVIVINTFKDDQ